MEHDQNLIRSRGPWDTLTCQISKQSGQGFRSNHPETTHIPTNMSFFKVKIPPKLQKSMEHDQNLIRSGGSWDTLTCQISKQFGQGFRSYHPETNHIPANG